MKLKQITCSLAVAAIVWSLNGRLQAADTDSRIVSAAKQSYVFKTYLKDDSVKVKAKDGIVKLTGTVANEWHKSVAEDTVAGLPGVTSVDNELVVKGEQAAARSDSWIATKVKNTLLFHRNVSVTKTEVSVKDGVVTLSGQADNQAQKELTTAYAKDVEGVKDVNNAMIVVAQGPGAGDTTLAEKIDDTSLTAEIKLTLVTHRSTSALRTKVETHDGVVTLGGNAKNAAEKDLVGKLVEDIKGVNKVINNMTVGSSD